MMDEGKQGLSLVYYCHPSCVPFQNIMRLPREEAFWLAQEIAEKTPGIRALYRFADIENYYALRSQTETLLYEKFLQMGGKPKERYPLYFVLQGSDHLDESFGKGRVFRLPLEAVSSDVVSFSIGDSCAQVAKDGDIRMLSKEQLLSGLAQYDGNTAAYQRDVLGEYNYMEVQLWDDALLQHIVEEIRDDL